MTPRNYGRIKTDIISWNTSGSPSQLFFNGNLVTKPQELAKTQNEFFLEKIRGCKYIT